MLVKPVYFLLYFAVLKAYKAKLGRKEWIYELLKIDVLFGVEISTTGRVPADPTCSGLIVFL
jgi:hypothetical protein